MNPIIYNLKLKLFFDEGEDSNYPIFEAAIKTDGISEKTNSVGKSTFHLKPGEYEIKLSTLFNGSSSQAAYIEDDVFSGDW